MLTCVMACLIVCWFVSIPCVEYTIGVINDIGRKFPLTADESSLQADIRAVGRRANGPWRRDPSKIGATA